EVGGREREPVEDVAFAPLDPVEAEVVEDRDEDHGPSHDHGCALRLHRRQLAPLAERERRETGELCARAGRRKAMRVYTLAVVTLEPEVECGECRHGARDADRAL